MKKLRKPLRIGLFLAALMVLLSPIKLIADPIPIGFDKNIVQFIFTQVGQTNFLPAGTCFSVKISYTHERPRKKLFGIPFFRRPSINLNFLYFVTAKHVLFDENGNLRPNLVFRESKLRGGVQYLTLSQELTNDLRILTHPDKSVDIAVISSQSVGITAVVPAYELHDILFSKEEKQFRAEVEKAVFPDKK